jgi:amino acid permease
MLAFTFNTDSIIVGVAGIVIWVICNILFSIYYAKVMRKDEAIMEVYNKMSEGSKCIYLGAVVCSIIITLRTYRVLYCGLFRGVAPYPVKKKIRNIKVDTFRERKGS